MRALFIFQSGFLFISFSYLITVAKTSRTFTSRIILVKVDSLVFFLLIGWKLSDFHHWEINMLSDMRIAFPSFFFFTFVWNVVFYPLTFSLYVSWGLKWISCRQNIYGSCFCIRSVSLCLLVGEFNPFTFKVIIDIYVPIAIFLIVWSWFCRYFSFSCIFWLYKSL